MGRRQIERGRGRGGGLRIGGVAAGRLLAGGANQFLAEFWKKGVDLYPLAPRKRGEGQGEGFPKSASSP